MRYRVLACDFDGTLATQGVVNDEAVKRIKALRSTGRLFVLVTGRRLDDLMNAYADLTLFDRVVAENGAVVLDPSTGKREVLGERPPPSFIELLQERGVHPIELGRCILATWEPHGTAVSEAVQEKGLELQVVLNKGAVMVLPSGVNKAFGLEHALTQLNLSLRNTVSVGDAENDHSLLSSSELGFAVSNSIASLKETADWVLRGDHGSGVAELIDHIVSNDLFEIDMLCKRRQLPFGKHPNGDPFFLPRRNAYVHLRADTLDAAASVATRHLEALQSQKAQFCLVIDSTYPQPPTSAVKIADLSRPESADELAIALQHPMQSVVIEAPVGSTTDALQSVFEQLHRVRKDYGRPHWLVWFANDDVTRLAMQQGRDLNDNQLYISLAESNIADQDCHPDVLSFICQGSESPTFLSVNDKNMPVESLCQMDAGDKGSFS